jgi:Rrf2 family iron-sulfur cluster assembly transcriptional regulator
LAGISKRQEISLSYLEQLFSKLRQRDLVTSVRGPGGGYKLSRTGDEIYVAEIIDAVNESIDATSCGGAGSCQHGEVCLTHYLWSDLSSQIHDFLDDISLQTLVDRGEIREVSARQNQKMLRANDEATIPTSQVI